MLREQKFVISTDVLLLKAQLWRGNEIKYGLVSVSITLRDLPLQCLHETVRASVEGSSKTAKLTGPLDYDKYL